jgi:uncharacterized repeat protein (TIGR03803 family)
MMTRISSRKFPRGAAAVLAVTLFAAMTAAPLALAQTETVLYNFCSLTNCTDGSSPSGKLSLDSEGNVYGTSLGGLYGWGTVYKVSPAGVETVLYNFGGFSGDGHVPTGGVTLDSQGNAYGVTGGGGAYDNGTAYKITPDGTETILHSFGASKTDGTYPYKAVSLGANGDVYGITDTGGTSNVGILFRIAPDGTETILHNFSYNNGDGAYPTGLTIDLQGNLYGTTLFGGTYDEGIAFELGSKVGYSILYNFGENIDEGISAQNPIVDAQGNLYGVTILGGSASSLGTVFELTPGTPWTETILHVFGSVSNDGSYPDGPLVRDAQGNLYGTTSQGGSDNYGTTFRISPSGTETILHNFASGSDGAYPEGLVLGSDGKLYGATNQGGLYSYGTFYQLTQ